MAESVGYNQSQEIEHSMQARWISYVNEFSREHRKLNERIGLEELFEEVYSEDTVKHIASGHAVARALRAHLLVQSALVNHISYTLIEENKLVVDDLESSYRKAMEQGITKR